MKGRNDNLELTPSDNDLKIYQSMKTDSEKVINLQDSSLNDILSDDIKQFTSEFGDANIKELGESNNVEELNYSYSYGLSDGSFAVVNVSQTIEDIVNNTDNQFFLETCQNLIEENPEFDFNQPIADVINQFPQSDLQLAFNSVRSEQLLMQEENQNKLLNDKPKNKIKNSL